MAQPPFQSDVYQVRGDSPGNRYIQDEQDGSLVFVDPFNPAGIRLSDLAGLQQIQNIFIVSPSGNGASKDEDGNPLVSIQAALDAVPPGTSSTNPFTILVGPGVYFEDVLWMRDGICMVALGQVRIRQLTSGSSTIRFLSGPDGTPRWARLIGFQIENTETGSSCVELSTSTFAVGTIALTGPGVVGDSVVIGGVSLTAILATGTPVAGQFRLGTTASETAQRLIEAIEDPLNNLDGVVKPSVLANVISLRAKLPGLGGNAITLSTPQPLVYVLSGPTLAGGQVSSASSQIGLNQISLENLNLISSGVGGFPIQAQAINNLNVQGCNFLEGSAATTVLVDDCASAKFLSCVGIPKLEMNYDSTSPTLPFLGSSEYKIINSEVLGASSSDLTGVGLLSISQSRLVDLTLSGTQTVRVDSSVFSGPITVGGTVSFILSRSTRPSLFGAVGTICQESLHQGGLSFSSSVSETFVFGYVQPNTSYRVLLESVAPLASVDDIPRITAKTTSDFTVAFGSAQTRDVFFSVFRDL